jgi:hypothetical protein
VEGFFPIFFLAVILKIPIAMLLYLVYWAIKAEPEIEEAPGDSSDDHEFRRWHRLPRLPRGPRRGPHAPDSLPRPDCPQGGRSRVSRAPAPLRVARAGAAGAHERGAADPGSG